MGPMGWVLPVAMIVATVGAEVTITQDAPIAGQPAPGG